MNEKQPELIRAFVEALDEFDAVLEKVPGDGLDWLEKEGEWTIRQVIHHVTDDCNVYTFVIERALVIPDCKVFFVGFPGNEAWADGLDFDLRPVTHALKLMRAHRDFLSELVEHFPDRWGNKAGFYDESGEKVGESSVEEMISMLKEHMLEHTRMIENIVRANQD